MSKEAKYTLAAAATAVGLTLALRIAFPELTLAWRIAIGALVGVAGCVWASHRSRPAPARRTRRPGRGRR